MSKNVKLKAYSEGNLGDDLFLEIICARYPKAAFTLCGFKKFRNIYNKIPNLRYRCYDSFSVRLISKIKRIFNSLFGTKSNSMLVTEVAFEEKYSKAADVNVYITGSGFMNAESEFDTLPQKYLDEKNYYDRKPYLIGCNFGPFAHKEYLDMYTRLFALASDVCFRDSYSLSLFPDLDNVRYAPDVVFSYDTDHLTDISIDIDDYMLISAANLAKDKDSAAAYSDEYISMLRRIVAERNKHQKKTVFIAFSEAQGDLDVINQALDGIMDKNLNYVYSYPAVSSEFCLNLFKNASSVFATRYHAMVLGLLFEKKVCALCYNEKILHVLQDIDKNAPIISLDEIAEVTAEQIENEKMYQIDHNKLNEIVLLSKKQFAELDKVLNY